MCHVLMWYFVWVLRLWYLVRRMWEYYWLECKAVSHPDFFLSFNMRLYITLLVWWQNAMRNDQWVIGAHYQHHRYILSKIWTYIHNMWIFVNISYHNLWILLSIICENMSTLSGVYKSYIVCNNIYSDYNCRLWGRDIFMKLDMTSHKKGGKIFSITYLFF